MPSSFPRALQTELLLQLAPDLNNRHLIDAKWQFYLNPRIDCFPVFAETKHNTLRLGLHCVDAGEVTAPATRMPIKIQRIDDARARNSLKLRKVEFYILAHTRGCFRKAYSKQWENEGGWFS